MKIEKLFMFLLVLLLPLTAFADLEAHFLDVGHGDCTIIMCDGESMIIDGGDAKYSDKVFSALKSLGISELKYAVATHPHDDHTGGLAAAFYACTVKELLTPTTTHSTVRHDLLLERSNKTTIPSAGNTYTLGGSLITILSDGSSYDDINDWSIILRIDYGKKSFLFTGDASKTVELDMIRACDLDVDVLKVAHHGSNTATSKEFVNAASPTVSVISCSSEYSNPSKEVMERLATSSVYITKNTGDIVIATDGHTLTVNSKHVEQESAASEQYYIGNANSKVFHYPTCKSVAAMSEKNKRVVETREEAENLGYRPCKNCNP